MNPETTALFGRLLEKHFENALSDGDAAEFTRLLENSDEALQLYFESVDVHVELSNRFAEPKASAPRASRRMFWVALVAATLVVATVAGYFLLSSDGRSQIATVERVEGKVFRVDASGRSEISAGEGLRAGQGLETNGRGRVVIGYEDGTRVELLAQTKVRGLQAKGGKKLFVERGTILAKVVRQKSEEPMNVGTPESEATVLGTTLRIAVDPDRKKGTRLEVEEGRVQFRLTLEEKSVTVVSGHYAVAAAGAELIARPVEPVRSSRAAELIRRMAPGTWTSIPRSNLQQAAPVPRPPGVIGTKAVMSAWSGAAYDTTRDRLFVWGGGQTNYGGNELYAFDLNALAWSRIWGPSPNIPDVGKVPAGTEAYSDGAPVSRSTYGGLEYLPATDALWSQGGSNYSSGWSTTATWIFDFATSKWVQKAEAPTSAYGNVSVYDPVTMHVFHYTKTDLLEYDPAGNTWTSRYSGGARSDYLSGAIDPGRRKFVAIGGGKAFVWDLTSSGKMPVKDLATTGEKDLEGTASPGFAFDPVSDKYVAWNGGADVYILDPATWVWTRVTPAPTNTVVPSPPSPRGTFGRFRYVPSQNAFIAVNGIDEDVFIYKLRQ